jgi:hypothetical protein
LLVGFWNVFGDEDKTFELRDSLKPPNPNPKNHTLDSNTPSFGFNNSQLASGVCNPPRMEQSTYKTKVTEKRKRSIPEIPDEFDNTSTPIHDVRNKINMISEIRNSNRISASGILPQSVQIGAFPQNG